MIIKEYKKYYLCKCPNPEHKDTHPSALLWKDTGVLRCMSCGFTTKILDGFERDFSPQLLEEEIRYFPLSERAISYLERRGAKPNEFTVSPHNDSGVGFLQKNVRGDVVGISIRLFTPIEGMRYIFHGKKMPFTGDIKKMFEGRPTIVFEKSFAWLRTQDENVCFLCSNGVNSDWKWWLSLLPRNIVFIFDNDEAGKRARNFLRERGAKAFISTRPTDELDLGELKKLYESVLYR